MLERSFDSGMKSAHHRDSDTPTVYIVDDDHDVRRAVALLARSVGLSAEQIVSPQDFILRDGLVRPACLVLDMRMPEMSGFEVQKELNSRHIGIPVIFISAHGDVANATTALRRGALDFLVKPYNPQTLIERIQEAISIDRQRLAEQERHSQFNARKATLTNREIEIMSYLTKGLSTKVIASKLGLSRKTVDNHRAHILDKIGVDNVVQLTRLANPVDGDHLSLNSDLAGQVR